MASFRSPQRGSNVVHRLEFQGLTIQRRRRRPGGRSARESAGSVAGEGLRPYLLPGNGAGSEAAAAPIFRNEPAASAVTPVAPMPVPGPADGFDPTQVDRLERRLTKLSRLLDDRDEQILALAGHKDAADAGVASIYRSVQGVQERGKDAKRRKDFMSKIFEANLKLRERVTSSSAGAE